MPDSRIQYLEGLRGLAALQVVLLHFVTAFLPDTAEHAVLPLRVVFDGHTAVYVFFLISGAVLTPSFARGGSVSRQAAKRLLRLGVPVAAAAVLALLLAVALPEVHRKAAALSGSGWLAMDGSGPATLLHLLREISLDSLVLGYREYTLFTPLADRLPLLQQSLNAPFWSLHLELYGSLLLLMLVTLQSWSGRSHRTALVGCAALFALHPMFLFVIGHLCAKYPYRPPMPVLGAALLLLGLLMSIQKDWSAVEAVRIALAHITLAPAPNLFQFRSQLAAVALFVGVLLCPAAHRLLATASWRALGRLSFSIYLVHFPILFTLACMGLIVTTDVLTYPAAVATTAAGYAGVVWIAAVLFERWVDRPAVRLSRHFDRD